MRIGIIDADLIGRQKHRFPKNFFYYNNGITIICSKMGSTKPKHPKAGSHIGLAFEIENPQIVNG